MRHKCTKCNRIYEEHSEEILSGCECGNKRFFFVKPKNAKKQEFIEIEDDDNNEIVVLDAETVNIVSAGKYEIDISTLLQAKVPVYRYAEGKYSIDIEKLNSK